ncbi:MAG: hypothetical protein AB1938_28450 [Myxococcota bacterium]
MLRRLLAVAVLGATLVMAQGRVKAAPAPAPASCQQEGAQCLKGCGASAKPSSELMTCVKACEARVDACRGSASGIDGGPAPGR